MTNTDDMQVVAFRVGPQEFAFEIGQVERILRYEAPSAVPNAPDYLEGLVPYAGGVVPVVDLRKRMGLDATVRDDTRLMVLRLDEQRIGVLVDQVREVMRLDSTTIAAPPPIVRGLAAAYIAGIISRSGRTILILNAQRLLSSTERLALSQMEG
jgi:purine-binding chemotaxis protein CheW